MLIQWLAQTFAMIITAILLPGLKITGIFGAFITVVALAFVNASIWDASLFFNVPMDFTTHTLTILGANAVMFWVLVKLLPGIEISGIVSAILAPVLFSLFTVVLTPICQEVDWGQVIQKATETVTDVRNRLTDAPKVEAVPE